MFAKNCLSFKTKIVCLQVSVIVSFLCQTTSYLSAFNRKMFFYYLLGLQRNIGPYGLLLDTIYELLTCDLVRVSISFVRFYYFDVLKGTKSFCIMLESTIPSSDEIRDLN